MQEFDSPVYAWLSRHYGMSAGTTYMCLRERNMPAQQAWKRLKAQVNELGVTHIGGSCRVVELRRIG